MPLVHPDFVLFRLNVRLILLYLWIAGVSDPGSVFQFSFWQNRSFTLLSLYTDMGEPSERCGDINFGVEYEYPSQTLKLKIIQVGGHTRQQILDQ